MSFKDFTNDFKKGITGDVLLFYGAEDFLMNWAAKEVVGKYVSEEARDLDVQQLDGDTCTAAAIMAAARAYSMFSDKRVVIVNNYQPAIKKIADPDSEALIEFCGQKQDSCVLVFIFDSRYENDINAYGKKLIKAASSYKFDRLDRASLQAFINKRVRAAGKVLGRREMDYLIDVSGYYYKENDYNLTKLNSDLIKITGAAVSDRIDMALIEELLVGSEDKFVFDLVDALMNNNKRRALEITESLIDGDGESLMMLGLLAKQFEIMYDALELELEGWSIAEMAKKTGVNEYRFKKAYQAARRFSLSKLKEILIKIYNIDRDFKTGAIDADIAFELLIVSI